MYVGLKRVESVCEEGEVNIRGKRKKAAWGRVEERERQSGKQSAEEWNCFQLMETLLSCEWMCRWMEKRLGSEQSRKRWEHVTERNMRDSSKFPAYRM